MYDFCAPDPMRRSLYAAMEDAGFGYLRQERAGRRPFVWHDLRHCFGTLAAQAFPLHEVQAYMGHQHISTTEIYLHHVPQADAAAKAQRGAGAEDRGGGTAAGRAAGQACLIYR